MRIAGTIAVAVLMLTAPVAQAVRGDTGVVDVSHTRDYSEGEEPLSVDPVDPDRLTTVANVFQESAPSPVNPFVGGGGVQDSRVYSTRDGGRHWTAFKLDQGGLGHLTVPASAGFWPEFSDAFNIINTDSDSVWDRHGNAYFESGDIHGLHHNGDETATVWRSSDGGLTWGPKDGYTAVKVSQEGEELDRPWFAADNSGGPRDGTLYMMFETSPFVDEPPEVFVKSSTDQGRTWSATHRVDDGTYATQYNPRGRPVVGGDGALDVVYDRSSAATTPFAPQQGPIELVLARSIDGGRTFARPVVDADVHRVTSPDEATSQYTEMISAIAAHPRRAGWVAVAWPEAVGTSNSRIVLRTTRDGGVHWSPRIDVADDPKDTPDQHDHVTLAWLPDGRLFAGWRDRRCCGGAWADRWQQWVRVLRPRPGNRWSLGRTIQYTAGPQTGNPGSGRGALQPDEFQGLTATSRGVSLTWSQLAGPYDDVMYRRVPLRAFGRR